MKILQKSFCSKVPSRKRGNARGFTLIEVILTCAVLAIFSSALALVMSAMQLSYVNSIETSYNRILANNVADAVKRQLSCAQILAVTATEVTYVNEYGQQSIPLNTNNPQIVGLTYDEKFYVGKEVQLDLAPKDEKQQIFTVTVSVTTLNGATRGKTYELKRSFQKLNAKGTP